MPKNLFYTLRVAKGFTPRQLAKEVGVQGATISKWENGTIFPSDAKLAKLAEVLGAQLSVLEKVVPRCSIEKCHMRAYQDIFCKTHYQANRATKVKTTITDNMKAAKTMGERLRLLRQSRALSVEQIAQTFGVTSTTVEAWESNWVKPTLHMRIDIAAYYKVGTRFLADGNVCDVVEGG